MNKTAITLMAGCCLLLSSCGTGNNEVKQNVSYYTTNLITDNNTGETVASSGSYTFAYVSTGFYDSTVAISTTNITFNNRTHSFVTEPAGYKDTASEELVQQYVTGLTGYCDNTTTIGLKDAAFLLTSYPTMPNDFNIAKAYTPTYTKDEKEYYIPGTILHPNLTGMVPPMVVAKYGIGSDYTVRTFTTDAFYKGQTRTTYPDREGATQSYNTENIIYRVIMDVEKRKAGLIIYNAKFTNLEQEPAKTALYLADLDVTFANGGYEISGTDVVPLMPSAEGELPVADYTFNKISIRTTNNWLTTVEVSYKVSGKMGETVVPELYAGEFSGAYATVPAAMNQ